MGMGGGMKRAKDRKGMKEGKGRKGRERNIYIFIHQKN